MTRTSFGRGWIAIAWALMALPGATAIENDDRPLPPIGPIIIDRVPIEPPIRPEFNDIVVARDVTVGATVVPCTVNVRLCVLTTASANANVFVVVDMTPAQTHREDPVRGRIAASGWAGGTSIDEVALVLGPFPPPPGCGFGCDPGELVDWARQTVDSILP